MRLPKSGYGVVLRRWDEWDIRTAVWNFHFEPDVPPGPFPECWVEACQ